MTAPFVTQPGRRCFLCDRPLERELVSTRTEPIIAFFVRRCTACGIDYHSAATVEQLEQRSAVEPHPAGQVG